MDGGVCAAGPAQEGERMGAQGHGGRGPKKTNRGVPGRERGGQRLEEELGMSLCPRSLDLGPRPSRPPATLPSCCEACRHLSPAAWAGEALKGWALPGFHRLQARAAVHVGGQRASVGRAEGRAVRSAAPLRPAALRPGSRGPASPGGWSTARQGDCLAAGNDVTSARSRGCRASAPHRGRCRRHR